MKAPLWYRRDGIETLSGVMKSDLHARDPTRISSELERGQRDDVAVATKKAAQLRYFVGIPREC